jgi:hypothetical protein
LKKLVRKPFLLAKTSQPKLSASSQAPYFKLVMLNGAECAKNAATLRDNPREGECFWFPWLILMVILFG